MTSFHRSPGYDDLVEPFLSELQSHQNRNLGDTPNYYASCPSSLEATCVPLTFTTGTGRDIYEHAILPTLASASQEIILVTCFWAASPTLSSLSDTLRKLSRIAEGRGTDKVRVRICFSSLSLFQKLFHTPSTRGQNYPPSVWCKKLGLPAPSELRGLDLQIKSVFVLPFSVMHPKFVIIDRRTVFLPSCNVSWEEWFEGCMKLQGFIVQRFLTFWEEFWADEHDKRLAPSAGSENSISREEHGTGESTGLFVGPAHYAIDLPSTSLIRTLFLPSPHHRNPRFQPFSSQSGTTAPPTPLNTFLLFALNNAKSSIYIQTPNLTSPPVLSAVLCALGRDVNVHIVTSARLMILEQLVTAGTTTTRCIKKLVCRYRRLRASSSLARSDEEATMNEASIGKLRIEYFEPKGGYKKRGEEQGEPQQSHLKMTVVDDEVMLLGSGNLDRASWFTSQELGVAFFDGDMTRKVTAAVREKMDGRTKVVYDSSMTV